MSRLGYSLVMGTAIIRLCYVLITLDWHPIGTEGKWQVVRIIRTPIMIQPVAFEIKAPERAKHFYNLPNMNWLLRRSREHAR